MITDFQARFAVEMSSPWNELVLSLKGGQLSREPITHDEFFQILQLIHTRDTADIAEGLLSIETLAEQLKARFDGYPPLISPPGGYGLLTPPLSLTVSSGICNSVETLPVVQLCSKPLIPHFDLLR